MKQLFNTEAQRKLIEQDAILSVIEGRKPWLGESAMAPESAMASLAAV